MQWAFLPLALAAVGNVERRKPGEPQGGVLTSDCTSQGPFSPLKRQVASATDLSSKAPSSACDDLCTSAQLVAGWEPSWMMVHHAGDCCTGRAWGNWHRGFPKDQIQQRSSKPLPGGRERDKERTWGSRDCEDLCVGRPRSVIQIHYGREKQAERQHHGEAESPRRGE